MKKNNIIVIVVWGIISIIALEFIQRYETTTGTDAGIIKALIVGGSLIGMYIYTVVVKGKRIVQQRRESDEKKKVEDTTEE